MTMIFDWLQQATILKRFLDELERSPKRTLGALAAVVLLTGAGATAAYRSGTTKQRPLSDLPTVPAVQTQEGKFIALPQPVAAEAALQATLSSENKRNNEILSELNARKENAPVTEREVRLLNETGQVSH